MVCEAVLHSGTVTVAQAFQSAVQHHQAGRLAEAEGIYRQILAQQPQHADALHLLGVIALQIGRNDAAAELIAKAVAISANVAAYHSNLGEAYRKMGRFDEAIGSFRNALRLEPGYAKAQNNLGAVFADRGDFEESVAAFRRAVELQPDYAQAWCNLGGALAKRKIGRAHV